MSQPLSVKQKKFTQAVIRGYSKKDAIRMAGYNVKNDNVASVMASRLVKRDLIKRALSRAGLTDDRLAKDLGKAIHSGLGVKATNSDAISGIRLAHELKGDLAKDAPDTLTQNNIYINELKQMDDVALSKRLEELTQAVNSTKSSP